MKLNTKILFLFLKTDSNDQLPIPLNQRNLPASFWNCNYQQQQQSQIQQHQQQNYQSNLVNEHSHHYLPLIEPSASTSSLQPLLQLETLSQLTHLQNHTQQTSSTTPKATSTLANFTTSNQHSTQNPSSLNNPINNLTFAHHLQQQHHQNANNSFNALNPHHHSHQQLTQNSNACTLLTANLQPAIQSTLPQQTNQQSEFLHQLLQQQNNHHPFQYTTNSNAAAIQSLDSNTLNAQNFQQNSNLVHCYNGSETPNNWSPHSAFIPLASPASSSSCSSNAENNVNRSNKLITNLNSNSLSKQYDHLNNTATKPTAKFALTSTALLQLNSTAASSTSPNRSPLSTSSPAQASHNNTLSPVTFHSSNNSSTAYQLTNLEKQRNSLFASSAANAMNTNQLQTNSNTSSLSNESIDNNNYLINNSSSPLTSSSSSITPTSTPNSSTTIAKSFSHFTSHQMQSTDPWPTSNSTAAAHQPHQPYLAAFHTAHNLTAAANYHSTPNVINSTATTTQDLAKADSYSNQYNSLLLAGSTTGSTNSNSSLNNTNNQSIHTSKQQQQSLTASTNPLQHTLAASTMSNHLTNYNYYQHLNSFNQINPLTSSPTEATTPSAAAAAAAAISFHHHSTANFHHHHYHNASNYNGYNYGLNHGLMTGKLLII